MTVAFDKMIKNNNKTITLNSFLRKEYYKRYYHKNISFFLTSFLIVKKINEIIKKMCCDVFVEGSFNFIERIVHGDYSAITFKN